MKIVLRRLKLIGAAASLVPLASAAAAQTVSTPLSRQLQKVDLGISGIGLINPSINGTSYLPQTVNGVPSNTVGALVELRYTRSPLVGVQFNYTYGRYNDTFNVGNTAGTPRSQQPFQLAVQSRVNEYTLGYVGQGPQIFGLQPFAGVGGGAVEFQPTKGGGQGLPKQVRGGLYYQVGVQQSFFADRVGLRAQFRQVFFAAPDFNTNYLATGARTSTIEPGIGFYLRF